MSGPLGYSGAETQAPSMLEPQPTQPVEALAQMVAELAGIHKDQAAIHRKQLKELEQFVEGLLVRMVEWVHCHQAASL